MARGKQLTMILFQFALHPLPQVLPTAEEEITLSLSFYVSNFPIALLRTYQQNLFVVGVPNPITNRTSTQQVFFSNQLFCKVRCINSFLLILPTPSAARARCIFIHKIVSSSSSNESLPDNWLRR